MTDWAMNDIKLCNEYAAVSPGAMRGAAIMAVLSIQQAWSLVPAAVMDVEQTGKDSRFLWGSKRDTYNYLADDDNMDHLYATTLTIHDPVGLLDLWTTVPGLGLAKAGFVVQLTRGMVGCVDTHNAVAYDVRRSLLTFPKGRMTTKAQQHKLEAYVALTRAIGGSQFMWEQWCITMAARYGDVYPTPEDVSRQHVDLMGRFTL